jgi:hypothetical protein
MGRAERVEGSYCLQDNVENGFEDIYCFFMPPAKFEGEWVLRKKQGGCCTNRGRLAVLSFHIASFSTWSTPFSARFVSCSL